MRFRAQLEDSICLHTYSKYAHKCGILTAAIEKYSLYVLLQRMFVVLRGSKNIIL